MGKIVRNNLLNFCITKPKTFKILVGCGSKYVASNLFLFIFFSVGTMFITCAGPQRTPFMFLFNHKGSTFSHFPCPSKMVWTCEWLYWNFEGKKTPLSITKLPSECFQNQRWKSREVLSSWNWWLRRKHFWSCDYCHLLSHPL